MTDESELLDIGAAARLLNVSETSLRRWTNAGVLPCMPEKLTEYESGLDEKIISKFPIAILCAYDAREFTGLEVLHALKVHPDTLRYPLGRALG